jgi:predicted DNA-binding transcriptional regulator AlpA
MGHHKLPPLCSSSDIAKLLGIERTSIPGMIKRNKSFPVPAQIIGSGPIWLVEDIMDYKDKRDAKLNKAEVEEA